MELVLTKTEQAVVWEGWLGSEIRANYFAELSGRFQERQRKITWLQLLLSSGAVAGGIAALAAASSALAIISPILALATAGLSYYSLLARNERRAAECAELYEGFSAIAADFRRLWDDMYAADARTRLRLLEERDRALGAKALTLPNEREALEKWEDYVLRNHALATT